MVTYIHNRRAKPDNLPGDGPEQRVFIGGQYDFLPTLRFIEQIVKDISCPEKELVPVTPIDYEIEVEKTMGRVGG